MTTLLFIYIILNLAVSALLKAADISERGRMTRQEEINAIWETLFYYHYEEIRQRYFDNPSMLNFFSNVPTKEYCDEFITPTHFRPREN